MGAAISEKDPHPIRRSRRGGFALVASIAVLSWTTLSAGGVNTRNGNYYVTYIDVHLPGGLSIERTYNSKSVEYGWFGFGWGSDYETGLEVLPDGTARIRENGTGSVTRFAAPAADPAEAAARGEDAAAAIVALYRTHEEALGAEREQNLRLDPELRHHYWRRALARAWVGPAQLPEGAMLRSIDGQQTLEPIACTESTGEAICGYRRAIPARGARDDFDLRGRLVQTATSTTTTTLKWGTDTIGTSKGQCPSLLLKRNNESLQLLFAAVTNHCSVYAIGMGSDARKIVARYRYDSGSALTMSRDEDAVVRRYRYDAKTNLTRIDASDAGVSRQDYDPKSSFIIASRAPGAEPTRYEYWSNPNDSERHYGTYVTTRRGWKGYEYELATRPDGETWTRKVTETSGGGRKATTYDECCGRPVRIEDGASVTDLRYDDRSGLVRERATAAKRVCYDYTTHGQVRRVTHLPANKATITPPCPGPTAPVPGSTGASWYEFQYDEDRLVGARGSDGQSLTLMYSAPASAQPDQVVKMTFNDPASSNQLGFGFEYDPRVGKANTIRLSSGSEEKVLTIDYDASGSITDVASPEGKTVALEVAAAFARVLNIVREADTELRF